MLLVELPNRKANSCFADDNCVHHNCSHSALVWPTSMENTSFHVFTKCCSCLTSMNVKKKQQKPKPHQVENKKVKRETQGCFCSVAV